MLLKSDVPPLEDMSGLIDQLKKLREEVSPENSVVTSTKTEDTQTKKTPETLREVMLMHQSIPAVPIPPPGQ